MKLHLPSQKTESRLAALRRALRKARRVATVVRAARAIIHFGPWRHVARKYIRVRRPPVHDLSGAVSIISNLDAFAVAEEIRSESVCIVGQLPKKILGEIRELTDRLPPNEYGSFDERHSAVRRLVMDPGVWEVARAYFGAEPVLLECNLVVQESEAGRRVGPASQRRFHFDYAGWHSLNLFVYLTDVESGSGAHQVVTGTHKRRSVKDAIRPSFDDDEIVQRYGPGIRTIAGPAGTLFFEDTEALHRRVAVSHRRAMLNILFASHRSAFSRGRLVEAHRELVHTLVARGDPSRG